MRQYEERGKAVAEVPRGERHEREIAATPFPRLIPVHPERRFQSFPAERPHRGVQPR